MSAQYGPHRWSAGYHDDGDNDRFHGARFEVADLRDSTFLDCDLSGARVVDGWLVDVELSGYVQGLTINGIDVTDYVAAELDRRHPERVQLESIACADDFRAMWDTIEQLWLPPSLAEDLLQQRVGGEWSYVETLRHLIYITDSWARRTILDELGPFHPLGLAQSAYRPADAAALGMDVDARPSYDEVLVARRDRMALIRTILDGLGDADLGRVVTQLPAPGYPVEERRVADCLGVVMSEEIDHHRFATRDLAKLAP